VGLTAYDDVTEPIDDPDYGEIKAYHYVWNSTFFGNDPIETRPCTLDDFDFSRGVDDLDHSDRRMLRKKKVFEREMNGDNAAFFPSSERATNFTKSYYKKMQCIESPISLMGDWDSFEAKTIIFSLERCNQKLRSTCKSPRQVREWLKDKFIILSYNTDRFVSDQYDESKRIEHE